MQRTTQNRLPQLLLIVLIILLPILLQILYTGPSLLDIQNTKWPTYTGHRFLLFFLWAITTLGAISLLAIRGIYLTIPTFISLIVALYIVLTGTNIEYEVYASIANTSLNEALEFVLSPLVLIALIGVISLSFCLYLFLLKNVNSREHGQPIKTKSTALLLLLGFIGLGAMYQYDRDALYKTYPLSIPFYFKMYYKEVILFKNEFNNISYAYEGIENHTQTNSACILIIGETARKQSMSIYDYSRSTTPYMESALKSDDIIATSYHGTSAGVSTRLSVPMILSTANVKDYKQLASTPTLPHIFNNLNYHTQLISNQERAGRNNDIIALMLNQVNSVNYLSESDDNRGFDEEIIPFLEDSLLNQFKPGLIIVHLMGSHWKYQHRYPEDFSYFSGEDELIDTYDNSILYTDYVIGKALDILQAIDKPTCLIYTSDHGENLNDNNNGTYLHAMKEMTEYEVKVPFFFAANKAFQQSHNNIKNILNNKTKHISHDNISHTLLGLFNIHDSQYYKETSDLSSQAFTQVPSHAINRRLEVINTDDYFMEKQ